MIVPIDRISPEVLENILDEFISREGTDYGEYEASLLKKREQLITQIHAGELYITYDDASESINIVLAREYQEE